jgi:nicotinate-nucleotide pyrophosphorylase (carboxylating)
MNETPTDPIAIALREDIGDGDITTEYFVPDGLHALGRVIARERAIVAGGQIAAEVFRRVDPKLNVEILQPDGTALTGGETILEVRGAARSILTAERVALNFLQRLSGIATLTRQFVDAVGQSRAKILDTRKTTPGLRALEKAAVVAGGGANHRFGLNDMVLVKDNHVGAGAGFSGFADTIRRLRQERPGIQIEVEADRLEQVRSLVDIDGINVILLDNMKPSEMREAVALGAPVYTTFGGRLGGVDEALIREGRLKVLTDPRGFQLEKRNPSGGERVKRDPQDGQKCRASVVSFQLAVSPCGAACNWNYPQPVDEEG